MKLRFNVLGIDIATITIDIDWPGHDNTTPAEQPSLVDRAADYFTRRFVKRRLL
jgi:hypothetical protein